MKFRILVAVLLSSYSLIAQKAVIKGRGTTSDPQPAAAVSVWLQPGNKGATADKDGRYEIRNVNPGSYKLTTSFVGLSQQETPVTREYQRQPA